MARRHRSARLGLLDCPPDAQQGLLGVVEAGVATAASALTGKGHATHRAVLLGLLGLSASDLDPDGRALEDDQGIAASACSAPGPAFDPDQGVARLWAATPGHANGMACGLRRARPGLRRDLRPRSAASFLPRTMKGVPERHPRTRPSSLLRHRRQMLPMWPRAGPSHRRDEARQRGVRPRSRPPDLDRIWQVMNDCIDRWPSPSTALGWPGVAAAPGHPSGAPRRAGPFHPTPGRESTLSAYAMAVNDEKPPGPRRHRPHHRRAGWSWRSCQLPRPLPGAPRGHPRFLLPLLPSAGSPKRSSIPSGRGGLPGRGWPGRCDGRRRPAPRSAAAWQIENAAEIAARAPSGLTCDPAGPLRVPCIEATASAALALSPRPRSHWGDGMHIFPRCLHRDHARRVAQGYAGAAKETSTGWPSRGPPGGAEMPETSFHPNPRQYPRRITRCLRTRRRDLGGKHYFETYQHWERGRSIRFFLRVAFLGPAACCIVCARGACSFRRAVWSLGLLKGHRHRASVAASSPWVSSSITRCRLLYQIRV